MASVASGWFLSRWLFGCSKVFDGIGRGVLFNKKGRTRKEFRNNMKRGKLWYRRLGLGSLLLSVESFSLGHCGSASLGCLGYRFGSNVDRVCLEVDSSCRRGFEEDVVDRSKGAVVSLSKLCLSPPRLRTARPAPSLQSQSSDFWPSSP